MKIAFLIYAGQLTVSGELKLEVLNQNVSRMTDTFTRNIYDKISCVSDDRHIHSEHIRQNLLYTSYS